MLSQDELRAKTEDLDFILRCQNDFEFFVDKVLNFQLSQFHKDQIAQTMNHRFVCIVNPVGHSKTTVYSVCYAIWRLWRERNFEICLISSSLDQSKKIMGIVQEIIQTNPFLSSLCPAGRDIVWNRFETTTTNGNYYYVKPFNSTIRGIHPNLIICDDILRETDTPMSEIKDLFWGVVYGRLHTKKGQIIVVGTPQTRNDLFTDIEKRSKEGTQWKYIHKSAVITDSKGTWIEPLWKEKFTLEELKEIKDTMGPIRFSREMMCNPLSEGASLYKVEDIMECCDDTQSTRNIGDPNEGAIYVGCDFAMSNAPSGDYSVFTVVQKLNKPWKRVKKTSDGIEYEEIIKEATVILNVDRMKGAAMDVQINKIVELNERYHPQKIVVDASNFGITFLQELQKKYMPVDGQMMPSAARNALLVNMCKYFEKDANNQRKLLIPTKQNDGYTYGNVMRMIEELSAMQIKETSETGVTSFGSVIDHDDCVFSLALALRDVTRSRAMPDHIIHTETVDRIERMTLEDGVARFIN